MQYSQAIFSITSKHDFVADLWITELSELGFDSFVTEPADCGETLNAYIQTALFDKQALLDKLADFGFEGVSLTDIVLCEDKDWNTEWEKHYFEPIIIGNECVIHSSFHKDIPACKYDIIIDPRMAFGTGHHQTTSLILQELLHLDLQDKAFLDMGCGTAVLAILARMRGAKPVTAIDIDNWCTENAAENIAANHLDQIEIRLGDAKKIGDSRFDVIAANINRNILTMDMPTYARALNNGGTLLLSGFYEADCPAIIAKAETEGLKFAEQTTKEEWAMVKMTKQSI